MTIQCAICYEKCNFKTECGHSFHLQCLKKWRDTQKQDEAITCPLCRRQITVIAYNTRAQSKIFTICEKLRELFGDADEQQKNSKERINVVYQILHHIWEHRIVLRQYPSFVKMVYQKLPQLQTQAAVCNSHILDDICKKLHRL